MKHGTDIIETVVENAETANLFTMSNFWKFTGFTIGSELIAMAVVSGVSFAGEKIVKKIQQKRSKAMITDRIISFE